jgi:gamma-glutamyltranspeptidase/glutathione hydrolase
LKIGFTEAQRHVADPAGMDVSVPDMLNQDLLAARAREISMQSAARYESRLPPQGGTVYLAAADSSGTMVSMIQSNFWGFGSGVVVPGTGISLHNRGKGFTLQDGHANRVVGGRRPFHTIIPGFATRGDRPAMSFGVMGQHMQPQGQVQMMTRVFDYGQNPQAASDAPRWQVLDDLFQVAMESGFDPRVVEDLRRRGHPIAIDPDDTGFGGAQLIQRLEHGYLGASDSRKDGQAAGY